MPEEQRPPLDLVAYWNKRYAAIDATKSGHIDLPVEYNAWLYRRKQAHVAKAVARLGRSLRGGRLLEVAAGSGAWMGFWAAQGVADYAGIDISQRAIDDLKRRFPADRFWQRDLNDLGLAGAVGTGYDCVAAIDVLYHVLDDRRFAAVIADLASIVRDDGLLIIHDQFLNGPAQDHGGYIRWRTLAQYEEALQAAGFEILYRRPTFFFMIQTADFSGRAARVMRSLWEGLTYPAIERAPGLAGAVGYAVDSALCALLHEGPSMELMVCRKRG